MPSKPKKASKSKKIERDRKPNKKRKPITRDRLDGAMEAAQIKSVRKAAMAFDVAPSTLQKHLTGHSKSIIPGKPPVLGAKVEDELADLAVTYLENGERLTVADLCRGAAEEAKAKKIDHPTIKRWEATGSATLKWAKGFLGRYPAVEYWMEKAGTLTITPKANSKAK